MKLSKNKIYSAVFVALMLASVMLITLPSATAQTTQITTYAFISASPKIIGLNEYIIVNSWVTPQPNMMPGTSNGQPRTGYYYDIYAPDGTVTVHGPDTSDGVGTDWFTFVPDQTGTWKVSLRWAGDDDFTACQSTNATFTVQSTTVDRWPAAELPTGYWTRPITVANREWNVLGGAWQDSTGRDSPCFNAYSTAPKSSHILWSVTTGMGGLIGGEYGSLAYSSAAPSKVIMYGRAYFVGGDKLMHCVDVHTGEELWATRAGSGSIFCVPAPTPYIWFVSSTRFERFNAITGASDKNVTGQPTGPELINQMGTSSWRINRSWMDSNGILYINNDDILERFIGNVAYDTKSSSNTFYGGVLWSIQRTTMNGTEVNLLSYPYGNATAVVEATYDMPLQDLSNMALDTANGFVFMSANGGTGTACMNMTTGELLWNIQRPFYIEGQGVAADGIGTCGSSMTLCMYGYNLTTGAQMWESQPNDAPWGAFRAYSAAAAYGQAYHLSYDGTVRAYNETTGTTNWVYHSPTDVWGETPYGQWPFYNNPAVADGVIFAGTAEHTPTTPLKRGDALYAIDTTTGDLLWSIMGCNQQLAISDGVLVASDSYQPVMFGFDKGQTETTVQASPKIVNQGSSILIEGTVMDLSPAQPNTPAVSDDSMTGWMEYLHMQQPAPTNTTGVPVLIFVTDPSGTTTNIASVTSDATGYFSYMYKPTSEGKFTITAVFEGTNSYYASNAVTAVGVDPASAPSGAVSPSPSATAPLNTISPTVSPSTSAEVSPTTAPTQAPPSTSAPNVNIYIIAVAAVVIVIVAAVAVALKKRSK
jgi:outer membrane protein assembly factor BamB